MDGHRITRQRRRLRWPEGARSCLDHRQVKLHRRGPRGQPEGGDHTRVQLAGMSGAPLMTLLVPDEDRRATPRMPWLVLISPDLQPDPGGAGDHAPPPHPRPAAATPGP